MTGFAFHPRFVEHDTGPHHPERPDRARAVARAVRAAGMVASADPFPGFRLDLGAVDGGGVVLTELPVAPADEALARVVHFGNYVDRVRRVCEGGGGVLDQADTPVGPASFDVALLSLGATVAATDAVLAGQVRRAFAAGRPPGHHAEPDRPMGFCLFNNIAIAARHAQRRHGVGKIAIVDFDVHHGNGTQAAFEDDPSVLFISLHQDPRTLYPGSGHAYEVGDGAGRGFTLNLPMNPGSDDADYLQAFDARVLPKLDAFRPELLMISAGFDAHRDDPLANVLLSEDGFAQMTQQLVAAADVHCGGRVVSVLEGGYHLRALGRCVVRHLVELAR